jgi:hypothetical protein
MGVYQLYLVPDVGTNLVYGSYGFVGNVGGMNRRIALAQMQGRFEEMVG